VLRIGGACALLVTGLVTAPVGAQSSPRDPAAPTASLQDQLNVEILAEGTSARAALKSAVAAIPFDRLQPAARQQAANVVNAAGLYRRLPIVRCEVDPRVHAFFTTHPDVAVSIWRAMDVSALQMYQTGPHEYESDAGDGTQGVITVLYRTPECCVVLCNGQFTNPLVKKPIQAEGLLCLYTQFARAADGRAFATHQADVFVVFPSQTVETVAKLISPVSNKIADKNLEELCLFLRFMDAAMSTQPGWVENVSGRLDGLLAGRPEQLLQLTAEVYVDAQRRTFSRNGQQATLEMILPPVRAAGAESPAAPAR
jgi:hypothetical protein